MLAPSRKTVCIHQPDFAPYLGFFHRLLKVDTFVIFDDAQFVSKGKGWNNRDKIKTPRGEQWLTLHVQKGPLGQRINEVKLQNDPKWIDSLLNLIRENYRKARFFDAYFLRFEAIMHKRHDLLIDLNLEILNFLYEIFGIDVEIILASSLNAIGSKNERLIDILQKIGATDYLSGVGARTYMDEAKFNDAQIRVHWQNFRHPVYPQLHGNFIPYLSSLDLIFNCGSEAKNILHQCDG